MANATTIQPLKTRQEGSSGPTFAFISGIKSQKVLDPEGQVAIDHLPTEVLVLIFKIYSMIEWKGGDVPWIKITHICRAWRNLALSTAVLWNYIRIGPTTTLERVATWLERSQQAPLTVVSLFTLNVTPNPQEVDINEIIIGQLGRIRELQMYLPDPAILGSTRAPAYPQLRSLSVNSTLDSPHGTPFLLLPHLDATFPDLQSLTLRNYALDIGSGRFPSSLTSLTLFEGIPTANGTVEEVLQLLSRLPLLEEFTIGKAKLHQDPLFMSTAASLPSVVLPHLRYLSISEEIRPCIELITHLTVPKGLCFNLSIQVTADSAPVIASAATTSALLAWVQQVSEPWRTVCFEAELLGDIDDVEVEDDAVADSLTFTASSREDARSVLAWEAPSSHQSRIVLDELDPSMEALRDHEFLNALVGAFDYSHVKTLVLKPQEFLFPLRETFVTKLNTVETIYIIGDGSADTSEFAFFLGPHPSTPRPIFPALKTLYVSGIYYQDLREKVQILKILCDRARQRSALQRLVLGKFSGPERVALEDFAELQGSTTVVWATEEELATIYNWSGRSVDELAVLEGVRRATLQ
ncbi:hypothetical protein BC629DRAFT_1592122 [Irpex lacteus]|nr:hypothetical protein BC629DRAFT_1592122 [Irpex lacteus]